MTDIRNNETSHGPERDEHYDALPPTEPITILRQLETPASVALAEPAVEKTAEKPRSRNIKVIAGIAGTAIVAAGAGGAVVFAVFGGAKGQGTELKPYKDDGQSSQGSEPASPTQEADATPTPEITPTVESLEIPAGLSAEKFGQAVTDRLTTWINGGADGALYDEWLHANGSDASEQVISDAADENSAVMAEALFGDDWKSNPSLVTFYDKFHDLNQGTLEKYVVTYNSEAMPDDIEPFRVDNVFKSARILDEETDGRVIEVTADQTNNAASNRIGTPGTKIYNQEIVDQNGVPFVYQYSTHVVKTAQGSVEEILGRQNVSQ